MKTILLTIAFVLGFAGLTEAQLEKGSFMIGTSLDLGFAPLSVYLDHPNSAGFTVTSLKEDSDTKYTSFNFSPKFGIILFDGLLVAVDMDFATFKEDDFDAITSFGVGPIVRYYFLPDKIRVFVQGNALFGSINYGEDFFGDDFVVQVNEFGGGAGVAIFLGDKVSLDFLVGFISMSSKEKEYPDDKQTMNTVGLDIGFSIFL